MDRALNIFCHVERLGPDYDQPGAVDRFYYFSLNLTAALTDDENAADIEQAIKDYLRPWKWVRSGLSVRGVKKNAQDVDISEEIVAGVELVPDGLTTEEKQALSHMETALDKEFYRTLQVDGQLKAGRFLWYPDRPFQVSEINVDDRDWRGFIAHVSTFPAPIPQFLRLTVNFRIKKAVVDQNGYDEIIAAPEFEIPSVTGPRKPQAPTQTELELNDPNNPLHRVKFIDPTAPNFKRPYFYEWKYDGGAGDIIVRAYQKECPVQLEEKPPESFLDLRTQWVMNPDNANILQTEDWAARFELKLADAFDMPARLLDGLRDKIEHLTDPDLVDPWEEKFEEGFVASLRDLAGYGLAVPADGESLSEYLIKASDGPVADIIAFLTLKDAEIGNPVTIEGITKSQWRIDLENFADGKEKVVFPPVPVKPAAADPGSREKYKADLLEYLHGLERIHTLLANDETLTAFFLAGWNRVFTAADTPPAIGKFWDDKKADITRRLAEMQIRKRYALSNVVIALRGLSGSLHIREKLKTSIYEVFEDYFDNRFGVPAADSPYRSYFPRTVEEPFAQIPSALKDFFDQFVDEILLRQEAAPDDDNQPEGLSIQVDQLEQSEAVDDQNDFLRRIAGVGILIRKKPSAGAQTPPWRCLNLANVFVIDAGGNYVRVRESANIPLRLNYRNELRQCIFFYNNYPLAATNPAQAFSQKNKWENENGLDFEALLDYENPYMGGASAPKLEPLIYGQDYEMAAYIIGNSGNLPTEIAATEDGQKIPWKLSFPTTIPSNGAFINDIKFRRTKAIGSLRVEPANGKTPGTEMGQLDLPVIPNDVHPIARSKELNPKDPLILLVDREKEGNENVWKREARSNFEFRLRPPSVPLDIWHYWTLGEESSDKRIYVWEKYHKFNDVAHDIDDPTASEDKRDRGDATIDDPSVAGFEIRMTRIYPESGSLAEKYSFPPPTAFPANPDGTLKYVQSAGRKITIKSHAGAAVLPKDPPAHGPIDISVPEGEIWNVEYGPIVSDANKFKDQAPRFKAVSMFVEVAKPFPAPGPARDSLFAALKPQFGPGNRVRAILDKTVSFKDLIFKAEILVQRWRWDGRPVCYFSSLLRPDDLKDTAALALKLGKPGSLLAEDLKARLSAEAQDWLEKPAAPAPDEIRNTLVADFNKIILAKEKIYNEAAFTGIELRPQTRTLLGRAGLNSLDLEKLNRLLLEDALPGVFEEKADGPVFGFPFGKTQDDETFDGTLFRSRTGDDYLQIPSQVDFVGLETSGMEVPALFDRDLSDSPGALYYRFAARVHNRYTGLMSTNSVLDSRPAPSDNEAERWKRLEVKCRWNTAVPTPVVKFICPLTQTISDERTPGFLVVLDEPWYQDSLGGLAEKFEADIIQTALPDDPRELRPQFGADPIIQMDDDTFKGKNIKIPSPIGAIGYTFDTETRASLFTRSSFIISAPRVDGGIEDLWWHFLKVRFRRSLDPDGLSGQPLDVTRSKWTDGAWIQALPPANRFTIKEKGTEKEEVVDTSDIYYAYGSGVFGRQSTLNEVDVLPMPSAGNCFFYIYVLLTREIFDALGRQNQEAYVDLVPMDKLKDVPVNVRAKTKARLVEIQSRKRIDGDDDEDIFKLLFPTALGSTELPQSLGLAGNDNSPTDADARIVRVSPVLLSIE